MQFFSNFYLCEYLTKSNINLTILFLVFSVLSVFFIEMVEKCVDENVILEVPLIQLSTPPPLRNAIEPFFGKTTYGEKTHLR